MKVILNGCCQFKCFVDIFTFISQLWKKQSWQSLFVNYIKTQQLHVMLNDSEVLWTKVESNWRARITFCLTMKNNSCRVSTSVEMGNSWSLLWNIEKFQILIIFGFQFWTKNVPCSKIWEMGILATLSFFLETNTIFGQSTTEQGSVKNRDFFSLQQWRTHIQTFKKIGCQYWRQM